MTTVREVSPHPITPGSAAQSAAATRGTGSDKPRLCGHTLGDTGGRLLNAFPMGMRRRLDTACHTPLIQRLSAASQAFASWEDSGEQQPRAAAIADEIPDVADLDFTVVSTPSDVSRVAESTYPEDWGTYLGTGGYCPS
jgi:hypothetical protein